MLMGIPETNIILLSIPMNMLYSYLHQTCTFGLSHSTALVKFQQCTVPFINKSQHFNVPLFLLNAGSWQPDEPPSLYIFINCSTRELTSVEKYVVWCFYF